MGEVRFSSAEAYDNAIRMELKEFLSYLGGVGMILCEDGSKREAVSMDEINSIIEYYLSIGCG